MSRPMIILDYILFGDSDECFPNSIAALCIAFALLIQIIYLLTSFQIEAIRDGIDDQAVWAT